MTSKLIGSESVLATFKLGVGGLLFCAFVSIH